MAEEIRIPDIGDIDEVEVIEICVAPGDEVEANDALIVIESDKASMEVPAGVAGIVEAVTVAVGDTVAEGHVIARIDTGEGAGSEGGDSEGAGSEGAESEGADSEGADSEGADSEGAESEGADSEGAESEGADSEGANSVAAVSEPASPPATETTATTAAAPAAPAMDNGPPAEPATLEIRIPDIGEAEGVVVIEVAVKVGQTVSADDLVVVVESDKASMEIPAGHAGTVTEVHVSEGSEVHEGTLLVTLRAEGGHERAPAVQKPAAATAPAPVAAQEPAPQERSDSSGSDQSAAPTPGSGIYAGPAVRRLARELGVDLSAVTGSGSRGRIVKGDVKSFVKDRMGRDAGRAVDGGGPSGSGIPPIPEIDYSKFGPVETRPLSRIRAVGASNLHRSWLNVPHVTQHDEADVTELEAFRNTLKAEATRRGVKITPLAFIIKACCYALKEFPTFNASLDRGARNMVLKNYYHIGFAVDTEQGLVVPVIKDADKLGIWELSAAIARLADSAREQKLGMGDMQGASFSVSSLGAIGGTGFTPIINAPEVAILGVARVATKPVWDGEEFRPRQMLPLSLSYDHRAINGAEAGRFVSHLSELLADIRRLAL